MQRRVALKNLAAAAGLVSMPAWASGWNKSTVATAAPYLSAGQDAVLAEIVETIIPATDTPGAKELGIHSFVQKMVTDCYDEKVRERLAKGVDAVERMAKGTFSKSFATLDAARRMDILLKMEKNTDPEKKEFFTLVKGLTIRGYLNSEYVMTNLTHYELVPGRYHGCVPVAVK
jgi:hypothetical protein